MNRAALTPKSRVGTARFDFIFSFSGAASALTFRVIFQPQF
jgi:hypothetical protein